MGGYLPICCAVALAAAIPSAVAEPLNCIERSKFVRHLSDTYAETPIAIAVTDAGNVIEFLFSKSGDSWTIITTTPKGVACAIAAGSNWQILQRDVTRKN